MSADRVEAISVLPGAARATVRRRAGGPGSAITLFIEADLLVYLAFAIYPVLVTVYNSFHTSGWTSAWPTSGSASTTSGRSSATTMCSGIPRTP